MSAKSLAVAVLAALLAAGAPFAAQADGIEAGGARLQLGGAGAASGATQTSERGVTVWRGARSAAIELAGGDEAPRRASAPTTTKKVIVVHHHHGKIRRLRTQGFFSGHPGKSRRFTQGFFSGPVDKGRRDY